jgi:integrase
MSIPATREGLRCIELEAQQLGNAIATHTFSWDRYLPLELKPLELPVSELVQQFKASYVRSNKIKESTWQGTWQQTFNKLPQNEPLTEVSILAVVLLTADHSRARELTCQRLQRLAVHAGMAIDLSSYKGGYGTTTAPRTIPEDEQIIEWCESIPNPQWRWSLGMMSALGLRPHELFFVEALDDYAFRVMRGKTGDRTVRAIPPDWVERWDLRSLNSPKVTGQTYRDYGQRVNRQIARYRDEQGLLPKGFTAYDLRHAYAIRGSVRLGIPVSTMAAMMGHSVAVHTKTYHRWLTDATNEAVYRRLVLGES